VVLFSLTAPEGIAGIIGTGKRGHSLDIGGYIIRLSTLR
jgi:hypothetical protein